ncbi:MAG: sulfurtransferase TusA family protein [Nitrospiraceae bacterium]|nr:MAG: sulfurtransferase TusA family protein [Nitrospiraceae bacterium]
MNLRNVRADVTLDMRGVACPLPPIKTSTTLDKMKTGEILEVIGYNAIAKRSAPWFAKRLGNHLLGSFEDEKGIYHVIYKRK